MRALVFPGISRLRRARATAVYKKSATRRLPVHRTDRKIRGKTPCAADVLEKLVHELIPGPFEEGTTMAKKKDDGENVIELLIAEHSGDAGIGTPDAGEPVMETMMMRTLDELVHWTGHASRLARKYGSQFGTPDHAREELIAEVGSAFLCDWCGLEAELQHPEYIAGWFKVPDEDKSAVIIAATRAQKAFDFLIDKAGSNVGSGDLREAA